jgi:hypothetical protein
VFGRGYAHAFRLDESDPFFAALRGLPPDFEAAMLTNYVLDTDEEQAMRAHLQEGAKKFVNEETNLAETLAANGIRNEQLASVMRFREFEALLDYLLITLQLWSMSGAKSGRAVRHVRATRSERRVSDGCRAKWRA